MRIPLADGTVLAGDLRRPEGSQPTPTIVCYYPYHKDDFIGAMYEQHANARFVQAGYATLLVDFRGLGSSAGRPLDGMHSQEGRDGAEIVEWAAAQPWCDGNVGMWGLSYGAITSFKTAAVKPPHLKAIVPIMGSLDIYEDWVYPGGVRNCLGACGVWGSWMLAMQLMPPMLQDTEGHWSEVWRERLQSAEPYLLAWAEHPDHDEYWRERAVDAGEIEVPTFLIGGWRDLFPETMAGAFAALGGPRRLLMGPWLHVHPDESPHEPIDHVHAMTRWWDRWLRDEPNGIERERPVQFFLQEEQRWVQSESWPPEPQHELTYALGADGALVPAGADARAGTVERFTDPTVGTSAGLWDPFGLGIGLPLEQSADDLRSLCFTAPANDHDVRIAGSPEARLRLALDDGADANLVVKLCDVAPDGSSQLITTGWLKARHRDSADHPAPVPEGEPREYTVGLWATAYRVKAGNRLRLSVGGADFPRVWPSRTNAMLRLQTGRESGSLLRLPAVSEQALEDYGPEPAREDVERFPLQVDGAPRWSIEHDHVAESASVLSGASFDFRTTAPGGRVHLDHAGRATVSRARPDGARVTGTTSVDAITPQGARVEVRTTTVVTADAMNLSGRVSIDGQPFFERSWTHSEVSR